MTKQASTPKSNLRQKRKIWLAQVKAWKKSGLSQAEYCRRQGLDVRRLRYWAGKQQVAPNQPLALVEVSMPKISVGSSHALKLVVDSRHQVEIADNFSPLALEQVLLVLRRMA